MMWSQIQGPDHPNILVAYVIKLWAGNVKAYNVMIVIHGITEFVPV